jgi:hypothetical protein
MRGALRITAVLQFSYASAAKRRGWSLELLVGARFSLHLKNGYYQDDAHRQFAL